MKFVKNLIVVCKLDLGFEEEVEERVRNWRMGGSCLLWRREEGECVRISWRRFEGLVKVVVVLRKIDGSNSYL